MNFELGQSSHHRTPSLVVSALSTWVPLGVNIVIALLLTPYLIANLGQKDYGTWALVGSFIGYYGLFRLGVGAGVMRYVPFFLGRNDPKTASEVVSTGMAIFLAIGLLIITVSLLVAQPVAHFYKGGIELASLLRILGLAAAIECVMRILDATVRSQERWLEANLVMVPVLLAKAFGLAGCVYLGYGIVEMGYVVLAVGILSLVLMIVLFIRFCPAIHLRPSLVKLTNAKMLLSFGILITVTSLVYTLTVQGHSLIIGKLISLEAVTIYAIPALIMRNCRALSAAPARVFWPRFAYLDGKNHSEEVATLFIRGARFCAIFASGIIFLVIVSGPSFISLWVGEGFRAACPILMLLAIGYLIDSSQAIMPHLLAATGHQGRQAAFACAEGTIGIGLSVLLTWQLGLAGAALGFVVAITLVRGLVCPWYICRLLNIRIIHYYAKCFLRPWLVLLVLTIAVYVLSLSEHVSNWPRLVILVLGAGCLYAFCAYSVAMNRDERQYVLRYIGKLSMRVLTLTGGMECK